MGIILRKRETSLKNELLEFLKEKTAGFWYLTTGSVFQTRGLPDIIGSYKDCFVAVEVKSEKGKLSRAQMYIRDTILVSGGIYMMVVGQETPKNFLARLDRIVEIKQYGRNFDDRFKECSFNKG